MQVVMEGVARVVGVVQDADGRQVLVHPRHVLRGAVQLRGVRLLQTVVQALLPWLCVGRSLVMVGGQRSRRLGSVRLTSLSDLCEVNWLPELGILTRILGALPRHALLPHGLDALRSGLRRYLGRTLLLMSRCGCSSRPSSFHSTARLVQAAAVASLESLVLLLTTPLLLLQSLRNSLGLDGGEVLDIRILEPSSCGNLGAYLRLAHTSYV
mmetsp:Transcript_1719/g.2226  ORF Transcript_1719/g.2226 Transcript_1719/m.2226 type:complete len:211 (+) Transcript_1719:4327-4959(+)